MGKKLKEKVSSLAAKRFIDSLGPSRMIFGLKPMRELTLALGQPQNAFPAIHVAGTNGKGSVCAMLASVYQKAGYRVGLYTSPHLESINERFQINGQPVSDRALGSLVGRVRRFAGKKGFLPRPLTQFEFLTAVAFLWFKMEKIDLAVIEVGLGGRLDATNVMDNKLLSIITNIDLDHTQWLGRTRSKIAFEKAGIIKPGVPVITGARGAALRVIKRVAKRKNSPLLTTGLQGRTRIHRISLKGLHQRKNAALAIGAVNALKTAFPVGRFDVKWGLAHTSWPGRFEEFVLQGKRGRKKIILDGAHNPAALQTLIETLKEEKISKVHLLFGVLKDKDAAAMVGKLSPFVDQACIIKPNSDRAADPKRIASLPGWVKKPETAQTPEEGFKKIIKIPGPLPVLVTGSLYLIGSLRGRILRGANKS